MTDQIDGLRAALESKRIDLVRSIRSQSSQLAVCESEPDVLDRLQGMCSRNEAVAFLDVLNRTLAEVDAALMAIKQGLYGTCVECEEPIASRRLQTIPWASHCIRCQESLENGNHMRTAGMLWDEAA